MFPPNDEELAKLTPKGLRALVVRSVRRACWEFMSFDDRPVYDEYHRETFVAVVHDLEKALDESDEVFDAACLRAGTLATTLRTEQIYGSTSPIDCYVTILNHTLSGPSNVKNIRSIVDALLAFADHGSVDRSKFESRPNRTIRIKAIRRDYETALKIEAQTASPPTAFGELWTDGEFPEYADYDESW